MYNQNKNTMASISRGIGWSQESNLLYQILKQLTRLTSIIFGLTPKYKVFTALLTQSGVDGPNYLTRGIPLTIGVTYTIYSIGSSGWDLTNVGAPNNDIGTTFIATGEIPNSYGSGGDPEYVSFNTGAPVATVLENTIGNIWFTFRSDGSYYVESIDLFTTDKTAISIDAHGQDGVPETIISYGQLTISEFRIYTNKNGISNDILYKNTLEIRVYN